MEEAKQRVPVLAITDTADTKITNTTNTTNTTYTADTKITKTKPNQNPLFPQVLEILVSTWFHLNFPIKINKKFKPKK